MIQIICTIFLGLVMIIIDVGMLVLAYKTTKSDPSDETVRQDRYHQLMNLNFEEAKFQYFCNHCNTNVMQGTKHCGRCNRCTAEFDHHCIWLNNCIGGANYDIFFSMLKVCIGHVIIANILPSMIILCKSQELRNLKITFLYSNVVLNVILLGAIGQLFRYHWWLQSNNMTTYQHIIEQRKQKSIRDEEKYRSKNQNRQNIEKQIGQGNTKQKSISNNIFNQANNDRDQFGQLPSTQKTDSELTT